MLDSTRSRRLLLIDDDEVFVRVLTRALAARGFTVTGSQDAASAVAQCREQQPDFAVLDLRLAGQFDE